MPPGFFKRAMVYLGLVDDEYDDYEDYEPRVAGGPRGLHKTLEPETHEEPEMPVTASTIRPLPREESSLQAPTITPRARRASRARGRQCARTRRGPYAVRRRTTDRRPPHVEPTGDRQSSGRQS